MTDYTNWTIDQLHAERDAIEAELRARGVPGGAVYEALVAGQAQDDETLQNPEHPDFEAAGERQDKRRAYDRDDG